MDKRANPGERRTLKGVRLKAGEQLGAGRQEGGDVLGEEDKRCLKVGLLGKRENMVPSLI